MLPAPELSEILANLSALNLQPNTAAEVLRRRARSAAAEIDEHALPAEGSPIQLGPTYLGASKKHLTADQQTSAK